MCRGRRPAPHAVDAHAVAIRGREKVLTLAAGRASHDRRAARIAGAAGYAGGAVVDEAAVAEGEARGVPGKDGACARSFFEASLRTQRELLHLPPSRPASLPGGGGNHQNPLKSLLFRATGLPQRFSFWGKPWGPTFNSSIIHYNHI